MPADIAASIVDAANTYGVDPRLALEVAIQESRLDPGAVSGAGAIGVMQLMPATAADLGVNPYDPAQNIDGGVRYLAAQLARFGGDTVAALAAYNWGPSRVARAIEQSGGDFMSLAPAETQNYVSNILRGVGQYTQRPAMPSMPNAAAIAEQRPQIQNTIIAVLLAVFGILILKAALD